MNRALSLASVILLAASTAQAQLIGVRTVPLATGDQFAIFPAERAGMGGVSIALDDPLLDPFLNPARGAGVGPSRLFSAPVFYDITNGHGSVRTLPVGAVLHSPVWFGGGAVALQQVVPGGPDYYPIGYATADLRPQGYSYPVPYYPPTHKAQSNMYGFGYLGRSVGGGRTTIAASAFASNLSAVDGVDMLYPGSQSLDQYGHSEDFRLGMVQGLGGGGSLALVALHNRFNMTHDVTYVSYVLQPCPAAPDTLPPSCPTPQTRSEENLDQTRTWGLHAQFRGPVTPTGWRIGGILTANYKDHPHIPNYDLMSIPRDPGTTWAFNAGVGFMRANGPVTVGLDVIYEPVWSHTWTTASECPPEALCLVAPGTKTVDNHFEFSNGRMRMGVARDAKPVGFQLGMDLYSVNYVLRQNDLIQGTTRRQHESWMEWTPTWALSLTFPELTVRYAGRFTTGTGQPYAAGGGFRTTGAAVPSAGDYVIAPIGPLTLQGATVITNQISVTLPIK
jgi:hypothetical protein